MDITREKLIEKGFKEEPYGDDTAYWLNINSKYYMYVSNISNTPDRDWYCRIDNSDMCDMGGVDVQTFEHINKLLDLLDIDYKI